MPLDRRVWLEATSLAGDGWRVTVICPRGRDASTRALTEWRDGVRILRYPQRAASGVAGYLLEYIPSLAATAAWLAACGLAHRIDVIHGCNPPDLFFLLARIARPWGVKYVYDQHDANPELAAAKWGDRRIGRWLVRFTTWLEARSYATADLVIVPNDTYANLARSRGRVSEDRIEVVRNAPAAGFRALAAGRSPGAAPFRVGYLGVMGSQDGVETLIDAVAALVGRRPDLDLHVDLVGDGEARHSLEARADAAGLRDVVTFHGYRGAEEFVPLLASTHVCISPDPPTPFNNVSTMTKVVEYLAIGRPVITFDLDDTRRMIGDAGWIVANPTAEALSYQLEICAERPDLVEAAAIRAAARFDELGVAWELSETRLRAAYRRLVADRYPEAGTPPGDAAGS